MFPKKEELMKRKIFFILLILSIITLTCISCVTPPKPNLEVVDDARPSAGSEAKTRADQARKQAMDFDSHTYFPSDWEAVENQYAEAKDAAAYNAVANTYNELFKKALPLYAQAREDEILAARDELIATGFTDVFPQYLKNADDLTLSAQDKYEAGDYYGAKDTAAAALNEYQTLLSGAKVYLTRQEIINRGFTQYDADNFIKADEVAQTAIDAYDAGDKNTAIANAEEALLRYNAVLSNGWTVYSTERRTSANKERELALADKANIASRDTFRKGEALNDEAMELFEAGNYSEAALVFVDAEANYAISRKETEEKRIRAIEAMKTAEEKIEESSEAAIGAEKIIEGGSR
jgi:1,2-phenylacetyl-CoA epoxidase PaaB subunit